MPLEELEQELRALIQEPNTINEIADILFPGVSGYPEVKLGLMCLMANQWDAQDSRERIHVLLYGKPGTGKTALMSPLEENWGAKYISMDPSAASLKSDARRKDKGAQIFNKCDGGIVCIDDFELMSDKNTLRDIMEKGKYTDTKGGVDEEYNSHCRILAASNDLHKIPAPIISRFDLIFKFIHPNIHQSMDIVRQILNGGSDKPDSLPMLQHYIYLVQIHEPKTVQRNEIEMQFEDYFKKYGIPTEEGEEGGKEGRWINSIMRIAKALARLHLSDLGPEEVKCALAMKHKSDAVIVRELK